MPDKTATMTLTEFLLARLADDEEAARAASLGSGSWSDYANRDGDDSDMLTEIGVNEFMGARRDDAQGVSFDGYQRVVEEHRGRPIASVPTADPATWTYGPWTPPARAAQMAHIARHDPARVLAEVEAKRRIVALAENVWEDMAVADPYEEVKVYEKVLPLLALPYRTHPDYDPTWAPTEQERP